MRPICLKCNVFFRPHRNGVYFTECMQGGDHGWRPYKIWAGDIWKCPSCEHQIISGVGANHMREHYEDDFNELRERLKADKINIILYK